MMMQSVLFAAVVLGCLAPVCLVKAGESKPIEKQPDGIVMPLPHGILRLQVWSDRIIRVTFTPQAALPKDESLAVIARPANTKWSLKESAEDVELTTELLRVAANKTTGSVTFYDKQGNIILREAGQDAHSFEPASVKPIQGTSVRQRFVLEPDEAIFGLGQHQEGQWNYRGHHVHLQQRNTQIGVPVLFSSRGYGLLWDNAAVTDVDVGVPGKENRVEWHSEFGPAADYYLMYGPAADDVIRGYRQLTGAAPMWGKWALGLWQSRERYVTQDEILGVAREYRRRQIPIDGMVQDWQYWFPQPWGSHAFGTNFPHPKDMMNELHDAHFHALISVWAKFDQGSKNYDAMEAAGNLYPPIYPNVWPKGNAKWYDPFRAEARQMYWQQIAEQIFSVGFDGWWLDATEPELGGKWGEMRDLQTGGGAGYKVFNAYPLKTTQGVYEGQRAQTSDKRVFILTRSAYTGMQRYAAAAWSGDIAGNWNVFQRQIPAGLNFVLTGIPYWNTDIGGFFSPPPGDPDYNECFIRWFQFGTFCPMFRVHGSGQKKELWEFGAEAEAILTRYDHLRYRLMPYMYSVMWNVTSAGGTMMRPLVMDFASDPKAVAVPDQFLFGPAIMVCPVTVPTAGFATVIPGESLADRDGKPGGLSAAYYQGMQFEAKKLERRDESISFQWDRVKREGVGENMHRDPLPGMAMTNFSARWEGFILTQNAGDYRFELQADDGMRLWIDGKLIVDEWKADRSGKKVAQVALPAQSRVPVKVEYFQKDKNASIELRWIPPRAETGVYQRATYVPQGQWCDFWTGQTITGGARMNLPAPLDITPLLVRAGSIIPMGPRIQYAMQSADPIELRVYPGQNGSFTLYDDEGDTYNYEKGQFATIPLEWNDESSTLTIGERVGEFPGMLKERTFKIVLVRPGHGTGIEVEEHPDATAHYAGKKITLRIAR